MTLTVIPTIPAGAATEAQARAIVDEYDRLQSLWLSEMRMAPDTRSLDQIAKKRPNPADYGAKLKTLLHRDLTNEWTLKYGAWLLENAKGVDSAGRPALVPQSQNALLNAVEKHHMMSPQLGRFCIAMINLNSSGALPRPGQLPLRSRGMKMLEKIKKTNPDIKVQGQASLALSIMLAGLGDDRRIMEQRIKNLRDAIIKSADVRIGDITVGQIAGDELFKIKNLSKGRIAPDFSGTDSAGRPLKLSDYKGKVVMLVFWSSWDAEAARSLEILRKSAESKVAKPFVLLGVNRDALMNLRSLEADRIVTWRNFSDPKQTIAKAYRVGSWPYCMILGKNGVIEYRGAVGSFADAVATDLLLPQAVKGKP